MSLCSLLAPLLFIGLALSPGEASAMPAGRPTPVTGDKEDARRGAGTVGLFDLQQTTRRSDRPPADPVGGFQISVLAGVQMRGSASAHAGIAISYFKRSTGNVGIEIEGGITRGPNGQVNHGLVSMIFQSGGRASTLAPYVSVGGGIYHAKERLRDRVAETLPEFGIETTGGLENGLLIAVGLGARFFLSEKVSFRADYREIRAFTGGSGGLLDRLFSLRRIGGFLSFQL